MLQTFLFIKNDPYIIVGEITVLILVIGFFYIQKGLKTSDSEPYLYSTLIVFKDTNTKPADYPQLDKLSTWTYRENLGGYYGQTKQNPNDIRKIIYESYQLDKSQVDIRNIRYNWFSLNS
ncbi:hypothetical protein AT575_08930 [Streptococcus penaeicida]|uniref:Uncharacterized protein n=1 Tax=Streptococcus penaeicida TaxID=1765960 RepID=A0A2N8LAE6_9STRE|nr:adenine glycosylase [Streptococcus penaeicida]PND47131.1 hypothetical protein AT575_08930 [Streptococcus penaeicida]